MTQFYGMRRLNKAEDWKGFAGEDNWVPTRSAFEIAYAWHDAGGFPDDVIKALEQSGQEVLHKLRLEVAFVEKPVFLDTLVGPSMNDLMGYARNAAGDNIVVAVEAKTDETFGLPVVSWVKGDRLVPETGAANRPSRVRRLKFLSEQLGVSISDSSGLRYQLLHRATSAILEGALYGAVAVVVIIHSFGANESDVTNWADFGQFLKALGSESIPEKNKVVGPLALNTDAKSAPLYFLWVTSKPRPTAI
jgi:hypothetical protein